MKRSLYSRSVVVTALGLLSAPLLMGADGKGCSSGGEVPIGSGSAGTAGFAGAAGTGGTAGTGGGIAGTAGAAGSTNDAGVEPPCCPVGWLLYSCTFPDGSAGQQCHDPRKGCASTDTCGTGCDPVVSGVCTMPTSHWHSTCGYPVCGNPTRGA